MDHRIGVLDGITHDLGKAMQKIKSMYQYLDNDESAAKKPIILPLAAAVEQLFSAASTISECVSAIKGVQLHSRTKSSGIIRPGALQYTDLEQLEA